MSDLSPGAPRLVTCRTTADLLAALPAIAGFTAADSLFLVLCSGRRVRGAARLDLPASEAPADSLPVLEVVSALLRELGAGSGDAAPAVVITSSRTFAACGGAPWRRFARRLERRLRRDGIAVRELACVAQDGWASLLDPGAPGAGRPLSEIAASPVAREARARGDRWPELAELGAIPDADPARAAAVSRALAELPAGGDPGGAGDGEAAVLAAYADAAALGRALRRSGGPLDAPTTARLIGALEDPDRWLALAIGLLTRPEFPAELARELGPARFAGVPAEPVPAPEAGGIDGAGGARPWSGWSIGRILREVCPGFTDHRRLPAVRERLLVAVSECPEARRAPLLAFSAWV